MQAALVLAVTVALAVASAPALAVTDWMGTASNNWFNGANWSAGMPDSSDDDVAGSVGKAMVTGSGSNWTSSETLTVGQGREGILEVLDGGQVESASGSIGTETGLDGRVRVSGVDSAGTRSHWEIDAGKLIVGDAGAGLLLVEAGGRVRNLHGFI